MNLCWVKKRNWSLTVIVPDLGTKAWQWTQGVFIGSHIAFFFFICSSFRYGFFNFLRRCRWGHILQYLLYKVLSVYHSMSQNHDLANALLYELFNTEWLSSDNNLQSHLMQNYSKKHDNLHGHLRWGRSCTQSNTISWKETDNVNIMQISSSQTHFSPQLTKHIHQTERSHFYH